MEGGRNSHATSLILNRRYYMLLFLSFDPPSFPPSLFSPLQAIPTAAAKHVVAAAESVPPPGLRPVPGPLPLHRPGLRGVRLPPVQEIVKLKPTVRRPSLPPSLLACFPRSGGHGRSWAFFVDRLPLVGEGKNVLGSGEREGGREDREMYIVACLNRETKEQRSKERTTPTNTLPVEIFTDLSPLIHYFPISFLPISLPPSLPPDLTYSTTWPSPPSIPPPPPPPSPPSPRSPTPSQPPPHRAPPDRGRHAGRDSGPPSSPLATPPIRTSGCVGVFVWVWVW